MLHYVVPCIDEYSNVGQRSNSNRYQGERYGQNFTMVGSSRNFGFQILEPHTIGAFASVNTAH